MGNAVISFPMLGESFSINPSRYFTVFGKNIYWYGVLIACGFVLAVLYAMKRAKEFGVTSDDIIDMLLAATPSAIIGARLYYVIFNPDSYFGPGKWINIIKIWEGGLAIYGGVIFAVLAVVIYSKAAKKPLGALLDLGAMGLLIGQCIGRWGNFMNREAFGAETDIFCRMGLTVGNSTIYVHPTFLYESLWNLCGFLLLHFISKKHRKFSGQLFVMYIGWYGFGRYFIEGLRTDSLYLFSTDIRVSQLLGILCFGIATIIVLKKALNSKAPAAFQAASAASAEETSEISGAQEADNSTETDGTTEDDDTSDANGAPAAELGVSTAPANSRDSTEDIDNI